MIYLDVGGRGPGLVPPEQAMIPVGDRGLLYGDGLFETLLFAGGTVRNLDAHLERLSGSAATLGIPCDLAHVERAIILVAEGSVSDLAVRVTLTRGGAGRRGYEPPPYASPTLMVTAAAYQRPTGPLRAITATQVRVNPNSPLSRHKSLSALEKVLARAEASQAGCHEAILLNIHGRVAEGAASNLFLRRGDRWLTPPLTEGCLPGIMRRQVMRERGAAEAPLRVTDLLNADGVYLTNALMGCIPLAELDGQPLDG